MLLPDFKMDTPEIVPTKSARFFELNFWIKFWLKFFSIEVWDNFLCFKSSTKTSSSLLILWSTKIFSDKLFSLLFNVYSENWPAWRGPTGNGISKHVNFPSKFSNTKNVNWKLTLPGVGSSTPAIWGDKIFVTSAIDSKDGVSCFSKNGNKLWDYTFGQERGGKHKNGSGSNPSPVTDGNNI